MLVEFNSLTGNIKVYAVKKYDDEEDRSRQQRIYEFSDAEAHMAKL